MGINYRHHRSASGEEEQGMGMMPHVAGRSPLDTSDGVRVGTWWTGRKQSRESYPVSSNVWRERKDW